MRGVKGTHGVAWYWKDKARVRLIAASVPRRQVAHTLAVYDVLVMLCNNHGDKRFTEHVSTICQLTGMSFKGVARAIAALQEIDLIRVVSGGREASGLFARRTFEITKGPVALSLDESTTGEIDHQNDGLPATESGTDTTEVAKSPVALSSYESANIVKNKRTRTEEHVDHARERAARTDEVHILPAHIVVAIEDHLPFGCNQTVLQFAEELLREHGEQQFLRGITETAIHGIAPSRFLPYLKRTLEHQKTVGYTWQGPPKREGVAVSRKPVDPVEARFRKSQLYRQLDADLEGGAFFASMRIKELAPRYNVDLAPYAVLDASPPPPKPEQRRLIQAFVATVDPSVTTPSYVDA